MKFLLDFLPIVLFFGAFKLADIYVATGVLMAATVVQMAITYAIERRLQTMQKAAATADIMAAILMRTPSTLTGKCNWARLAFGFARAFSRSKLVALDVADLREDSPGRR